MAGHRCTDPRHRRFALRDQLGDRVVVGPDLLLHHRAYGASALLRLALEDCDPFTRLDHVRMGIAVGCKGGRQGGFGGGQGGVRRPAASLREKLPVLIFEAGDLCGEAAGIHERGSANARDRRTVGGLQLRDLALDSLDLALELRCLLAEEAHGQVGLLLDLVAVHAQELRDIGLHHGLRFRGVRVIEAHRDRDDIVPSGRGPASDVARKRADRRCRAHFLDHVGHRPRSPLGRIKVVLLNEADEIAAAQDLLADLRDALLDLPRPRRVDDVRREVLGLDQHGRGRPVHGRQAVGGDHPRDEQQHRRDDDVIAPVPQDRRQMVDQPCAAAAVGALDRP